MWNNRLSGVIFGHWLRAAHLAAVLVLGVSGCSLMGTGEATGGRPWSGELGHGMRGGSPSAAESPAEKVPFWQKYRDKRVGEINQNLNVEEPPGF